MICRVRGESARAGLGAGRLGGGSRGCPALRVGFWFGFGCAVAALGERRRCGGYDRLVCADAGAVQPPHPSS